MKEEEFIDPKNKSQSFLWALESVGKPIPTIEVSRLTGISMRDCGRISSNMVAKGRASRIRPPVSVGGGYYHYFLNEEQLEWFYRVTGRSEIKVVKGVDAIGAIDRLRFLTFLKERTIYRDHAILSAIIDDYKRTLIAARGTD